MPAWLPAPTRARFVSWTSGQTVKDSGWRRAFARFQRARWFLLGSLIWFGASKGVLLAALVGLVVFAVLTAVFLWREASDDAGWIDSGSGVSEAS